MLALACLVATTANTQWQTAGCTDLHRRHVHEAGHILCGHLVGLDVTNYFMRGSADGEASVEFVLGPAADHEPRALDPRALQALGVAAMGGAAAEMVECGNVVGAAQDVAKLLEFVEDDASSDDWLMNSTRIAKEMIWNHRLEMETIASRIAEGAPIEACVAAAKAATTVRWYDELARAYPNIRLRQASDHRQR